MVRCRLMLQVFPLFQQTYTMITTPLSKENSHVSIKRVKHLMLALIPGVKAMHPSLQHLQGRKRHPDDWAQFPSACNHVIAVQPRSFHKTFTATHTRHSVTSQPPSQNQRCSEARQQPSSACEPWIFYQTFSRLFSSNSYTSPKRALAQHTVHLKRKPSTSKAATESNNPKLTKAAPPSHALYQFSVTPVNS